MRISDWSSDVCSSDLLAARHRPAPTHPGRTQQGRGPQRTRPRALLQPARRAARPAVRKSDLSRIRSEEHTSELQSLMRISYAVFCLKKKNQQAKNYSTDPEQQNARTEQNQHSKIPRIMT